MRDSRSIPMRVGRPVSVLQRWRRTHDLDMLAACGKTLALSEHLLFANRETRVRQVVALYWSLYSRRQVRGSLRSATDARIYIS